MNQAELEHKMVSDGIDQQYLKFYEATEGDNIDRHPALGKLLADWVRPLAILIDRARANIRSPQSCQTAVKLLLPLDSMNIAFLATRAVIRECINEAPNTRHLALTVGSVVHSELYLSQFSKLMGEDLFFTLSKELGRRGSKDGEYRYQVFRQLVKDKGIEYVEWSRGHRDVVGAYLLQCLRSLGMITWGERKFSGGKAAPAFVSLSDEVQELIIQTERNIALTRPAYAPCIEPPRDWVATNDGGWHTPEMRRLLPYAVKVRGEAREAVRRAQMPVVWGSLNALQKTAWRVNKAVLEAITKVARLRNVGELVMNIENDKPPLPEFMAMGRSDPETEAEAQQKKDWKAAMTGWYNRNRAQTTAHIRMAAALRQAREYRQFDSIYFVYFADSRGRLYPMAQGLNPQGTDLQKGLIEFSVGLPLDSDKAVWWFMINGANLWGFDKAPLEDRANWHVANAEKILAIANDPIGNQDWLDADSPCMFLAWCFEYADFKHDPAGFVTHMPVHLDGSCSGLQHLSAMLRDEIGGASTNLMPSPTKRDIYGDVAKVTQRLIEEDSPEEGQEDIRAKWLENPADRSAVKRWVMTTPYGVTKSSGLKYVADYLSENDKTRDAAFKMATYAAPFVDKAIKTVVLKGMAIMAWLKKAGREAIGKNGNQFVSWKTPSGFLATQSYNKRELIKVYTQMYGHKAITVAYESNDADARRHGTGMAPNFVHSMDASHLHLVANRMCRELDSPSLAFIHDSFGTHATNTQLLYEVLRDEFVMMYETNNPLADFAEKYEIQEPLPERGNLDVAGVRQSQFVFS